MWEMEGIITKLVREEFLDGSNSPDVVNENSTQGEPEVKIPNKSVDELSQEEETLQNHLDKLKKENFTLQASIKAWQTTLKNKLDEFKEADLKLDEIYNEIWSEREKFCAEADKFNGTYGILSDWWATQMKFVSDLENLEKKNSEDQKCRREIQKLEKEVEELKKEINVVQVGKQVAVAEVHATEDESQTSLRDENPTGEISSPKKQRLHREGERMEISEGTRQPTKTDLYSLVDLERVRMVNRNRNRFRKSQFFGKVKKLLTM